MKYLLDTHTLLWLFFEPAKLSPNVTSILKSKKNKLNISIVTFWEIATKVKIGKLTLSGLYLVDIKNECKKLKINILPVSFNNTQEYLSLPLFKNHRDPFDRMLIATSINDSLPLLSCDSRLPQYVNSGLSYIW